jgi:ATP-dependent Lon protease
MFPIEFDHQVLDSLPLPSKDDALRVVKILKTIVGKRLVPFFKRTRGTDPLLAARVTDRLRIYRLEDSLNRVRCVSVISRSDSDWSIGVHERVFDYLSFVIPSDPESTLGGSTTEERKMLAFAELMLRHDLEHTLYPGRTERDVVMADLAYAMDRRANDPTFYRMLRNALADEMNGLKGERYLALFDCAEQDTPQDELVSSILNDYLAALAEFPENLLEAALPSLDKEIKTKVLGLCYRRSRDTAYSLLRRTGFLHKLLKLFAVLVDADEKQAEDVFNSFKDDWGLVFLFQELDVPEATVQNKTTKEMFRLLRETLRSFSEETGMTLPPASGPTPATQAKPAPAPVKSLKDRIEEARNDTAVPRQVMEVIDKNRLNAVGHSGSKYSELIETLLAIPWGEIRRISVSPLEFESGLNATHYGLQKPKELLCDFFANLVWRYQQYQEAKSSSWRKNGSAFLFVGPPGVGKTSLAISIAMSLGIPFHKISLGGMRDEADLKGHGFTYEGSKPGAIVQGLIKMGAMNGMFIMDEADKMEKFAVATLLEILDPEQNHLFHDKYTESTVDIDLSNCHFVLTANTMETVPPAVANRCEVVQLDRYSVDEKVAIAREHLIGRVRGRHQIGEDQIYLDPEQEEDLLRFLVRTYTYEAGVRQLERIIRTLFLRVSRKEILSSKEGSVCITREKIKQYIETPRPPRPINDDDRVGEMMALGVNVELGIGSLLPVQATPIRIGGRGEAGQSYLSMVHATGNIEKIMDESRKVATTAILHCAGLLGIRLDQAAAPIHLHFMGASTPKDGPSAGGAIALALASALSEQLIRRDVAMTGEIDTHGRITTVGALDLKLETAFDAGCNTVIIPRENLLGDAGIERLSDALKDELQILTYDQWKGDHEPYDQERHMLQVVAVDNVLQAVDVSFIDEEEISRLETCFNQHAGLVGEYLATTNRASTNCLHALYVKEPAELDLEEGEDPFWGEETSLFLVRPEHKEAMKARLPGFAETGRMVDFDPVTESLAAALDRIGRTVPGGFRGLERFSLVAPYFALKQNLDLIRQISGGPPSEGFRLFANNYTTQRVKIKACKPVLNRLYWYLSQLDQQKLDECPFLGKSDGVYVIDISFIPEKYRLDVKRAEKIVEAALKTWLIEVDRKLYCDLRRRQRTANRDW